MAGVVKGIRECYPKGAGDAKVPPLFAVVAHNKVKSGSPAVHVAHTAILHVAMLPHLGWNLTATSIV